MKRKPRIQDFVARPLGDGTDQTERLRSIGFDPKTSRLEVLVEPWDGHLAGVIVAVGVDEEGDAVVRVVG